MVAAEAASAAWVLVAVAATVVGAGMEEEVAQEEAVELVAEEAAVVESEEAAMLTLMSGSFALIQGQLSRQLWHHWPTWPQLAGR